MEEGTNTGLTNYGCNRIDLLGCVLRVRLYGNEHVEARSDSDVVKRRRLK